MDIMPRKGEVYGNICKLTTGKLHGTFSLLVLNRIAWKREEGSMTEVATERGTGRLGVDWLKT